jgi:ABC-type Zn uptake system ZnuABC Zn-binding protein ZnuA
MLTELRTIFVLTGLALFVFILPGCSGHSEGGKQNKQLVIATTTIIADIAQEIAGDRVEVYGIMPIGGDPHVYQPVPGDARMIVRSDLVLLNGLQLEGWLTDLVRHAGGTRPMIEVTEGITPLVDEERRGEPDPHAWFDVRNMHYYVDNILRGLLEIDPEGKEEYLRQVHKYKEKLDELDSWIREEIELLPEARRILITSHDAFRYFGKAYGVRVMALQGISTEAQPQTKDVIDLVEAVRTYNVPAVFIETSVNPKMLEQLARDAGTRIGGELFSDSIGHPDHEGGTYLGMVRYNVRTFIDAMKNEPITTR